MSITDYDLLSIQGGGGGGGLVGQDGLGFKHGYGGTATAGGACGDGGNSNGTLGTGGNGSFYHFGSGGGGGYYGGGGAGFQGTYLSAGGGMLSDQLISMWSIFLLPPHHFNRWFELYWRMLSDQSHHLLSWSHRDN